MEVSPSGCFRTKDFSRLATARLAKCICPDCKMCLSKSQNVFVQITKCICPNHKMYLYKLQNVFVQITKCICPNCKMYLSKCQVQFMCHALPSAIQVIKPHMSHMADRIYIYKESQIYVLQNQRNPHHHKTAFVAWPLAAMSFVTQTRHKKCPWTVEDLLLRWKSLYLHVTV